MKLSNNKGFTLVELLVAISILGIITIIVLPQLSNIQDQNKQTKYAKYAETMLTSGKLYVDSYTEDMFGNNTSGCVDITYLQMKERGLLKDIKVDNATCGGDDTFVRVWKSNDHYTYETFITCEQNGKEVYSKRPVSATCSNQPDTTGPVITFKEDENGTSNWTKGDGLKTTVLIYDDYGLLENTKIRYAWFNGEAEVKEWISKEFDNKRYEGTKDKPLELEVSVPKDATGYYYLKVEPVDVRDANGIYQSKATTSNAFKLDNTAPTCGTNNGPAENAWTNSTRQITVNCIDSHSGCKKTSYKSQTYESGTVPTGNLKIYDNVGNENTCTFNVYVDKEAPEMPKDGSIGKVSGSNTTGTIQTPSSPTTDVNNGSGFKEIRYIINNTGTTPKKSDFTSTSLTFPRSCGTTYYAYSVAVDNAGNISSVRKLGNTSDGADSYDASWSTCDKKCGGGKQYKYNSCELKAPQSQECNKQSCCSSTEISYYGDWSECSAACGGGTKYRDIYLKSSYDGSSCGKSATQDSASCNKRSCCSSTWTDWGEWSECSASCGDGIIERFGTIYSNYDNRYCGEDSETDYCNEGDCEPEYPPNDCNIRGSSMQYQSYTWKCTCGRNHTSGYTHYCTDSSGQLHTRSTNKTLVKFSWVCPISPYGPAQGWTVIDD